MSVTARIIVCGSRNWTDKETLFSALDDVVADQFHESANTVVLVHGACPYGGADAMAEAWFNARCGMANWDVRAERHPAKTPVTAAFHARNQEMADRGAVLCIGFTDGRDPDRGTWGTGDMFSRALAAGIPVRGVPSRRKR